MSWFDPGSAQFRAPIEAMTFFSAGLAILAVWAGLSRWHWFVRALIVSLAIATLLPIRAYEPALLFMLVVPLAAVTVAIIRHWFKPAMATGRARQADRAANARIGIRVTAVCYSFVLMCVSLLVLGPMIGNANPFVHSYWPGWYEWTAFGAIVVGLAVVTTKLYRDRKLPGTEEETTDERPSRTRRLRFGLRDLLLLIVVVAMASATLASIVRKPLILDWPGLLGTAACLVILAVLAACVAILRRGWIIWTVMLVLAIIGSAALHTWVLTDWTSLEAIIWLSEWLPRVKTLLFAFSMFATVLVCLTFLLAIAGTFDKRTIPRASAAKMARVALILVLIAVYVPLAVVYYRMLAEMPVPKHTLPDTNAYPQIMAAVEKLHRLNPTEATIADIRDVQGDLAKSKEIAETYRKLMKTLEQPAFVPLDLEQDARHEYFENQMPMFQVLRSLARTWVRESDAATAAKQFDMSAEYGLASVRLGAKRQTGGIIIQSLVGSAIEGIGVEQINRVRRDTSSDEMRRLIEALEAIDRDREPPEVTIAREAVWNDRAYTWRNTLGRESPLVLALTEPNEQGFSPSVMPTIQAFEFAMNRRDAMHRLLMADFAIRLFQHDEGRLPESFEELCPRYLSAVPLDPYSDGPLIYRRVDDTYVLYSVWQDGDDDGGRFGAYIEIWDGDDFDLDLDVNVRSMAPPPAPAGKKQ
ncbi:MAG: hypothetical protein H8E44_34400 [Planctomycetes bacterium]|nr:hypothetical protein [Planctomycetota bacterium]MBL7043771.1 hypothetical protein [Pirellulaceae bacterium]